MSPLASDFLQALRRPVTALLRHANIATADRPPPRCLTVLRKQTNAQTNWAAPELARLGCRHLTARHTSWPNKTSPRPLCRASGLGEFCEPAISRFARDLGALKVSAVAEDLGCLRDEEPEHPE